MPTGTLIRDRSGKVVSSVSGDRAVSRGKGQTSTKGPSLREKAIARTTDVMESVSRNIPGTAPNRLKNSGKKSMLQIAEERRRREGDKASR